MLADFILYITWTSDVPIHTNPLSVNMVRREPLLDRAISTIEVTITLNEGN